MRGQGGIDMLMHFQCRQDDVSTRGSDGLSAAFEYLGSSSGCSHYQPAAICYAGATHSSTLHPLVAA